MHITPTSHVHRKRIEIADAWPLSDIPGTLSKNISSDSQPFRAGLTFAGRPSGPRIRGDCRCHLSLKLSQAI